MASLAIGGQRALIRNSFYRKNVEALYQPKLVIIFLKSSVKMA
jgi:hypothetical protein